MTDRERMWRIWYEQKLEFIQPPYRGTPIVKNPCDLWAYQAIIDKTKPDLIIETGTFLGGSAVWLADRFDGDVISVDLAADRDLPQHDRVEFIAGVSSTDPAVIALLNKEREGKRTMVILDSDHSREHVLAELGLYAPMVSKGCYLVVEDTNPFAYRGPAGPERALRAWNPPKRGFTIDREIEPFLTCHPGGYLRRIR